MSFNWNYSGKGSLKKKLYARLNNVLNDGPTTYTILYGPTGNGKTTIVFELAKLLNVNILRITANKSYTTESINNTIKSLNLQQQFDSNKKHIILIDDFDDFKNKSKFLEFPTYTSFPIIYTCQSLQSIDYDFRHSDKCEAFKIDKLIPTFMEQVLIEHCQQKNIKYTEEQLHTIATQCPSIRKGLILIETASTSKEYLPNTNIYNQLKHRTLSININYKNLLNIIDKIHTYNPSDIQSLQHLSFFEFLFKYDPLDNHTNRHYFDDNESLDKDYFNLNIKNYNPIFKDKPKRKKKKPKKKKQKQQKEPQHVHEDISSFF